MKTLFLMRHAKSSWKDNSLDDIERPLNARGEKDAPKMAEILKKKNVEVEAVFTSPALRAAETAKIIWRGLNLSEDKFVTKEEIYAAGVKELLQVVKNFPAKFNSIIMFGHNPGLTNLQNVLTEKYIDNIPTAGVVKIVFDINQWKEIEAGTGKLEFFEYPKKYK